MQQQASVKSQQLHFTLPPDLKITVNKNQFCMVVRNLFNNAVKYTQAHGKIHISASLHGEYVRLTISDNGIGMSEERQRSLFTFKQTCTYGTQGEKGIGLGLLVCKQYIEANNGTISVQSTQNVGTTVITEFPNALSNTFVNASADLIWK